MEGEEVIDPVEISKTPKIIKDAQEEIGKLDVFVCGECHDVFHYIEHFQQHRETGQCTGVSMVRENYKHEPKAQVWAFMLWKHAQFKKTKEGETMPTSWIIYQRWCKLNSDEKDAWVIAGQNIQSFTKISAAKVQEIKTQMQTAVKSKLAKPVAQESKTNIEDDPLEEGEIRLSQLSNAQRVAIKAQVATNKANSEVDPLADAGESEMDTEDEIEKSKTSSVVASKKAVFKPLQLSNDISGGVKKLDTKKALRTIKNENAEETVVEKILNRRFNPKQKCMEYLVKWENLNESETTWEPKQHLEKCKAVVEEFDKVFNRSKMFPKVLKRTDESHSELSEPEETTSGRPQRTSKQKALNQVKAWCGDITDNDDISGKRKSFSDDDDDSSDSYEKKIKLEEETDSSEDEKPSVTIRRVVKGANSLNGLAKKLSDTTPRVSRVVNNRITAFSSGVYIMSKTEGIIKLDSNTPPAGSPLLKVGPKIGQTHIKVVKKEIGPQSNVQRTPTKTVPKLIRPTDMKSSVSTPKPGTKILAQRSLSATPIAKPPVKPIESSNEEKNEDLQKSKISEDDSDGVEDLDFPTDLPLPEPESPPGEFILCPLTGKILGQVDEDNEQIEPPSMENTSLDNLVKEAVADLSDVDLDTATANLKSDDNSKTDEITESSPTPTNPVSVIPITITPTTSISTPLIPSSPNIATPIIPASIVPSSVTPTSVKTGGQTRTCITTSIIPTGASDDIEDIPYTTIKVNSAEASVVKSKPVSAPSILNSALTTTKINQNPTRMAPPKKLLSTPNTVRQKVTTVNRSPINRPIHRPSPTTAIIHKITPSRNRPTLPKTIAQQDPVLKRTSNVTTYKPANVARRIGNTTIYKTSEKPISPVIKKVIPPTITTTIATITQPTIIQTSPTSVINMPLLTTDEEAAASENVNVVTVNEIETIPSIPTEDTDIADLTTFSIPDSESPLLLTGDDGTIYQVAGQNEDGQTILISAGPDGQQQCVLVSSDATTEETSEVIMDTAGGESDELEQTLMINTQTEETDENGDESQVVAQIIKADPPSPGGTRKVVLMLPDGNLMMTDVTAEQYAALELDK